jgi:hypothetical protein
MICGISGRVAVGSRELMTNATASRPRRQEFTTPRFANHAHSETSAMSSWPIGADHEEVMEKTQALKNQLSSKGEGLVPSVLSVSQLR